jgi:hypothetical protein
MRVTERGPDRAVVVQDDRPELANHVGVRHASAVYLAGLEASRELATAIAGDGVTVELAESDIRYGSVPSGTIAYTAEPLAVTRHRVATRVVADVDGREVATLDVVWLLAPPVTDPV